MARTKADRTNLLNALKAVGMTLDRLWAAENDMSLSCTTEPEFSKLGLIGRMTSELIADLENQPK